MEATNPDSSEAAYGEPRGPHVVSLIIVNAVVDALRQRGAGAHLQGELEAAQAAFAKNTSAVMPRATFVRELERVSNELRDPTLGLALGESLTEMSFHFIGPLIASQVNLRETMGMFLQLSRTVLGGARWGFMLEGDDVLVGHPLEREYGMGAELEAEMAVTAVFRNLVHWLGTDGRRSVKALFAFAPPPHVAAYREVFGDQVSFSQPLTGVRFPAALLERSRPGASEEFARGVREFSERWLPRSSDSWSARVRQEFASIPNLGTLSFDSLASRWGLSSRSLRRRLASENASLSSLLEEARLLRAREMLARRQYSLPQISELLGYSEVNSFQRAFKRWAGTTPGSFRRSAQRTHAEEHAAE
ncbi:MAG TPA: AraC family transcriptional regulator ligand-binding domain-containing protein [Polyangiales bacterium]